MDEIGVPRLPAAGQDRRLRLARALLVSGTVGMCLLQVLALPVRNPLTRTISSYEYTWAGWLFPMGIALFAAGMLLLCWHVPTRHRAARMALFGSALGAGATAVFPSGSGERGESLWPGEVHRWGSIALVVCALWGALLLARDALPRRSRRAIGLMTLSALAAGALFMSGQLAPAPPGVLGYAPLAGGLSQRIVVGVTVAAILYLVAMLTALTGRDLGTADAVVRTGHVRPALDTQADAAPVHG